MKEVFTKVPCVEYKYNPMPSMSKFLASLIIESDIEIYELTAVIKVAENC
jgi:hypothetical protein